MVLSKQAINFIITRFIFIFRVLLNLTYLWGLGLRGHQLLYEHLPYPPSNPASKMIPTLSGRTATTHFLSGALVRINSFPWDCFTCCMLYWFILAASWINAHIQIAPIDRQSESCTAIHEYSIESPWIFNIQGAKNGEGLAHDLFLKCVLTSF